MSGLTLPWSGKIHTASLEQKASSFPSGDKIPFLARILSVADAYDAMNSDRAYRKKMETEKILSIR